MFQITGSSVTEAEKQNDEHITYVVADPFGSGTPVVFVSAIRHLSPLTMLLANVRHPGPEGRDLQ